MVRISTRSSTASGSEIAHEHSSGLPDEHAKQYPGCDPMNGDLTDDGNLDGADIDAFFECLGGGVCP